MEKFACRKSRTTTRRYNNHDKQRMDFAMSITQVRAFFEKPSSRPLIVTYQRNSQNYEAAIDMTPKI